jgi:polyisoprenoid-binding protein YceI
VKARRPGLVVATVLGALLMACTQPAVVPPNSGNGGPADFPMAYYRQLLAEGAPVYRVDPAGSLVVMEVRRGGSLGQFGHDHVVASHDVTGSIAPVDGRADLYVSLDALTVDEPLLRADAGFNTQPDPDDIAGTRRNMLERVLDTRRYPYAQIAVNNVINGGHEGWLRFALTLHGKTRLVDAAAELNTTDEEIHVTGTVAIDQTQFGIVPLSILGGAISVQDRVKIRFRIQARRM